jgi:alkanesulfonate monooxygenase SsuD/methylene tetrahydromethanopterin reductase-like flavin-dependent oxidoreductase (luciferase family)
MRPDAQASSASTGPDGRAGHLKVGLLIMDEDPRDALRVAKAADQAGIHSIWSIDYYNRSSLARAATFAAVTESVLVGTSVTPLFARAPLALAAAASDVQSIAGGRFVLGVGTSTRRMNQDWYGVDLDHPAPRLAERIGLVRQLMAHRSGPFSYDGRFDRVAMAHFDNEAAPSTPVPILAAGVGERMVQTCGSVADGLVGHPIASVENLRDLALPLDRAVCLPSGWMSPTFTVASQVIASVDDRRDVARARAAQQVGFYSTVKGYDVLFDGGARNQDARQAAREAFAAGDHAAVGNAATSFVEERAVFGSTDEVSSQLARYEKVIDWVMLYSPHYGVAPSEVTANELALIDIASRWKS